MVALASSGNHYKNAPRPQTGSTARSFAPNTLIYFTDKKIKNPCGRMSHRILSNANKLSNNSWCEPPCTIMSASRSHSIYLSTTISGALDSIGSPPHTQGTPMFEIRQWYIARIAPAYAGNTL